MDSQNLKSPRLNIRVSRYSIAFSAVETDDENSVFYQPYAMKSGVSVAANLREALKGYDLLTKNYHRCTVLIDSPSMMIPLDELQNIDIEQAFRMCIPTEDSYAVMHNVLPNLQAAVVFPVNKDLKVVLEDNFPGEEGTTMGVTYLHVCVPVWNHLHKRSFTGNRQKLFAYFHDKHFEVFSFAQNRIRFANRFKQMSTYDNAYFLLSVWNNLSFNQAYDELHLVGKIPEEAALVEEMRKYVENIYIVNPSAEYNRAPLTQISDLPYDLLTQYMK